MRSEGLTRAITWISAFVLAAGVIAFATVQLGRGDDGGESARPAANAQPASVTPEEKAKKPTGKDVPRAARLVAGQFILSAVGREDLKKAWRITHPSLRAQCACSYKQWLTGNIPVDFYPVKSLDLVSFAVEEVTDKSIVLHVALLPAKGEKIKPQTYFLGLRQAGKGKARRWMVDYFAAWSATIIPSNETRE